jgi:hypothetical protein
MEQNTTREQLLEIYITILLHKYKHLSQRVRNSQLGVIKEISFSKLVTGSRSIFLEDNIINEPGCHFLCHIHVFHYVISPSLKNNGVRGLQQQILFHVTTC